MAVNSVAKSKQFGKKHYSYKCYRFRKYKKGYAMYSFLKTMQISSVKYITATIMN